jgi:hypothetical protein
MLFAQLVRDRAQRCVLDARFFCPQSCAIGQLVDDRDRVGIVECRITSWT